jgi:hypothetical protein
MAYNPSKMNQLIALANEGNLPAHLRALLQRVRFRPLHEQQAAAAEVQAWLDSNGKQTFLARSAATGLSVTDQVQFEAALAVMNANAAAKAVPPIEEVPPAPSLVDAVRQRRSVTSVPRQHVTAASVVSPNEVPEPPSLVTAINNHRNDRPTYNLDGPIYGGGPRPRAVPTVNAAGEIDDPPSLTASIRERRAAR